MGWKSRPGFPLRVLITINMIDHVVAVRFYYTNHPQRQNNYPREEFNERDVVLVVLSHT